MNSWKILGVKIDFGLTLDSVIEIIESRLLKDGKNHVICTTNPEFIMDAQDDTEFKKIINESDLSLPDGSGVIYAKNYLEKVRDYSKNIVYPIRAFITGLVTGMSTFFNNRNIHEERVSGVDLTYKICEVSAKKSYSVFLLGGRYKNSVGKFDNAIASDMATQAADTLRNRYPGVNIVGSTSAFSYKDIDDSKTIDYIKKCMHEKGVDHIDFLFVAYNHINQEKWIVRNNYKIPARISVGCGGTFDYIIGYCKLPPETYVRYNLGWLYRVFKQPWRVKRVLKAFPKFPMKVFLDSVKSS